MKQLIGLGIIGAILLTCAIFNRHFKRLSRQASMERHPCRDYNYEEAKRLINSAFTDRSGTAPSWMRES